MNNETTASPMARLVLVGLALAGLTLGGCARPIGAWFDSNSENNNLNWNYNFNGNVNWNHVNNNNMVNHPPLAICPEDATTAPGRPVSIEGDGDDDHGIVEWEWYVVAAPAGSTAAPSPVNAAVTTFTPDRVGDFLLRLTVTDAGNLKSSCSVVVASRVGPPTAFCPEDMDVPTRTEVALLGDAVDDGYIVRWSWEVLSHNTDTEPELGTPDAQNTTFEALRVGQYLMRLTVEDDHGLTHWCQFTITTTPTGPDAICPADINTVPLATISWSGDAKDDGTVVSWQWQMISQPTGSAAASPAPATSPTVSFEPDIVGEYRMRLTVMDDDQNVAICEFSVFATPGEGLRVELFWNPPESPSDNSDVDLHLLHPTSQAWFDNQGDCYYANCNVSNGYYLYWDIPNIFDDDPRLDLDDVNGYGPENINIDEPVIGNQYKVGVHYFSDHDTGPANVHVKIYCGTISINPVYEVGPMVLNGSSDSWGNDFWKVAGVTWNGFDCIITPINQIVSASQASSSP